MKPTLRTLGVVGAPGTSFRVAALRCDTHFVKALSSALFRLVGDSGVIDTGLQAGGNVLLVALCKI